MNNYRYIILALLFTAFTFTANAKKQKQFYDSKSNIVGITGDYNAITASGFTAKFFNNEVEIPAPVYKDEMKRGYDEKAMLTLFETNKTGKRILDYLFQYDGKQLSEDMLRERAMQNAQTNDMERAEIGVIDKETLLKDDYLPILKNNFIYLQDSVGKKVYWIVFRVNITEETLAEVFNSWNNMEAYNQIKVPVTFVAQGSFKNNAKADEGVNKHLKKVSSKVPELAIRGQVTGRNPFITDFGTKSGLRQSYRVDIYRAVMKDSTMYSKRVSKTRVAGRPEPEQSYLYTVSGRNASYKKGDVAVLNQDFNKGHSLTFNYMDHSYGLNYTFDWRVGFSKTGWSTYIFASLGAGVFKGFTDHYYDINAIPYESPLIANVGLGAGIGKTCLHALEIMPYIMGQYEALIFLPKNIDEEDKTFNPATIWASSIRIPVGLKFHLNIYHPLQLVVGAEYVPCIKLKSNEETLTPEGYEAADRYFLNPQNYKRSGFNIYAGFRLDL